MKRRTYLVAAALGLGGCTSALDSDDCVLHNRVVPETTTPDDVSDGFEYSSLSERGKDVFRSAVRSDTGAYSFEHDGGNAPEEFEYTDQVSTYLVEYEGCEYSFETRTNAGCTVV